MRLRRADLKRRVNGKLALRFNRSGLTSYAGLELVGRYFREIGLTKKLRRHMGGTTPGSDYGVAAMVKLLLCLLIVGGRRVRHVLYLRDDPLVERLSGLKRLPTARSIGRWLGAFRVRHLQGLIAFNEELVEATFARLGLGRLTIDVDGSVVSTGMKVAWAKRGYNPHRRKVPSYYPITAYEAQSGQIVRVKNRPGNVNDGKASLGFLRELFSQLGSGVRTRRLEFRMDAAFFRRDVLELLDRRGAEYAIKVPFVAWTGLRDIVRRNRKWQRVDATVSCFERKLWLKPWQRELRVVIYRKRVHHKTRKNFQLDLFDPADGHYEYSAVATNKSIQGPALWNFMNGRSGHEQAYGELKHGFAFGSVPSLQYAANSAWQMLNVLAFNLMRGFQIATGLDRRRTLMRRRSVFAFQSIQTLRYEFLHRAGVLVRPDGRATLEIGNNPAVRSRFLALSDRLAA
jgi:hypothetical protein